MAAEKASLDAIRFNRENGLSLLDQRNLPRVAEWIDIPTSEQGAWAIKEMVVRGAPAIAIAGLLAVGSHAIQEGARLRSSTLVDVAQFLKTGLALVAAARPTAVNLPKAAAEFTELVDNFVRQNEAATPDALLEHYWAATEKYFSDDVAANQALARFGATAIEEALTAKSITGPYTLLTHCNTGSLATAGYGTALGVIRTLMADQKIEHVYCTETRPYHQGSRLTAFELVTEKIPATLITDSMVPFAILKKGIQAVVVGADRVAANGDTANKIGTYMLAIAAHHHNIPFFIAAPVTTLDPNTPTGNDIHIEERPHSEVRNFRDWPLAPAEIGVWNPSFDVAPHNLITGIITDVGTIYPNEKGVFDVPAFIASRQ